VDASSERPPEQVDFAAARIGRGRRRPPIVALAWIVVLAGAVGLGLSGRSPDEAGAGTATTVTFAAGTPGPTIRQVPTQTPFERIALPPAPVITSEPGRPISLQIQRHTESLFVHGDVNVAAITWVFVSVIDDDGRVVGWSSVSVPGGVGSGRDHRPSLRFDVEIPMPDWAINRLWVQATAYDATGGIVGAERLGVDTDGGPVILPIDSDRPLRPETPRPLASVTVIVID
jgi:hypothetical protein